MSPTNKTLHRKEDQIKRRVGHQMQMQDVWKGAGVYRTCAVKLQCIGTDEVFIKTQRTAQNKMKKKGKNNNNHNNNKIK